MIYKRFRIAIVIRVVLLMVFVFMFFYLAMIAKHQISAAILAIIIGLQTYSLIRYVEQTNKKLAQFFTSIRHADFSTSFSDKSLGKNFDALHQSLNEVITEFKKHRAEKQEHYNYLQTVVQHINIGIICYKADGSIDMFNNTAKRLFKKPNIRTLYDLESVKAELPATLLKLKAGDKSLIKIFTGDEIKQLSAYATEFKMRGEEFTLVAFQDIHAELEEKEIESWQKLIRVLTHEIMNSITPISSLASTVNDMLIEKVDEKTVLRTLEGDDVESVEHALATIQNRSKGLLNFVDIYRNLTRIPKPNFRYFQIREAFDRAEQLLTPKIERLNINCQCKVFPTDLKLTADPDLIDQVLINLILNAIDAVKNKEKPEIKLSAYTHESNRTYIEISDNGSGIKQDIIEKIFMPFFTSKEEGSGIGLSLSRQIMHLHKGVINVKSKPDEGTIFTLVF